MSPVVNTTPPTRAEFEALQRVLDERAEALAKRVAALEATRDHGHAEPAPAMPKCPKCGEQMRPAKHGRMSNWECVGWKGGSPCLGVALFGCACGASLCADHLQKPEAAQSDDYCDECGGTGTVDDDEASACGGTPFQPCPKCRDRPNPAQPPAPAGVTTLGVTTFWQCNCGCRVIAECFPKECPSCSVGVWVANGTVYVDQRAAVEAACAPLRARMAEAESDRAWLTERYAAYKLRLAEAVAERDALKATAD